RHPHPVCGHPRDSALDRPGLDPVLPAQHRAHARHPRAARAAPRRRVSLADTHRAVEAVWRIESARVIAGLTRIVKGDIGLAEELAQDALVAALERWPESGIPDNPGAWLMATAKHRAIHALRRRTLVERKHEQVGYEIEAQQEAAVPDLDASIDDN